MVLLASGFSLSMGLDCSWPFLGWVFTLAVFCDLFNNRSPFNTVSRSSFKFKSTFLLLLVAEFVFTGSFSTVVFILLLFLLWLLSIPVFETFVFLTLPSFLVASSDLLFLLLPLLPKPALFATPFPFCKVWVSLIGLSSVLCADTLEINFSLESEVVFEIEFEEKNLAEIGCLWGVVTVTEGKLVGSFFRLLDVVVALVVCLPISDSMALMSLFPFLARLSLVVPSLPLSLSLSSSSDEEDDESKTIGISATEP